MRCVLQKLVHGKNRLAVRSRSGTAWVRKIARRLGASDEPVTGYFHFAADAGRGMHEIDGAAKCVGYHAANYAGAIAWSDRRHHVWAVALPPVGAERAVGGSVQSLSPMHRDMAA